MTMDQINQQVAALDVARAVDIAQEEKSIDADVVVTKGRGRKQDDDEDDFMTMDQINAIRIENDLTISTSTADMNSKGGFVFSSINYLLLQLLWR